MTLFSNNKIVESFNTYYLVVCNYLLERERERIQLRIMN